MYNGLTSDGVALALPVYEKLISHVPVLVEARFGCSSRFALAKPVPPDRVNYVTLSGLLVDGEQFSFELNSVNQFFNGDDFFSPDATLTVTLTDPVPEPSSAVFITLVLAIGLTRRRR